MLKIQIEKIDWCIESLAYVAPYHEILKFETAAILHGPLKINFDAFFQFIFDNADLNCQDASWNEHLPYYGRRNVYHTTIISLP